MCIDRIRIDWDKVSEDSYLTRIPAIGLLQELAFRRPVTFFVGENAVVGAASVVTKDIPDDCIAVGNPARVIKTIPEK